MPSAPASGSIRPGTAGRRAGRLLAALIGSAAAAFFLLAAHSAPAGRAAYRLRHVGLYAADTTDSTRSARTPFDTTDSGVSVPFRIDTTRGPDTTYATPRADRYLPGRLQTRRLPPLVPDRHPLIDPPLQALSREVALDSTGGSYTVYEQAGRIDVRPPLTVSRRTYRRARRRAALDANWRALQAEHARRDRQDTREGLGMTVSIPGGRQSAFSTIFGTPEVDLRVTGLADINAGFDYRRSDQQGNLTGDPSRIDPDFAQDLRLGITGTVGDKLQVNVNWDTQSQFDYQNQVRLEYTGYDDEIIQKIEAGNVFLETPSTLIQGGQSLFGIKAQFQFGNLHLTTVASQQEGQASSLSIEGGAETRTFSLKPTDYDDATHFFLAYYFRNRWNEALSDPPAIVRTDGFQRITEIEVWKLQTLPDVEEPNVRQVVAVVDLGEPDSLLTLADEYTAERLPRPGIDQYTESDLDRLRSPNTSLGDAAGDYGLTGADYQTGRFRRLERGRDYVFNEQLGYLTLTQRLQDSEALAVAFRYQAGGQTVQVGDFTDAGGTSGGANADRIVLKLLRPAQMPQPGGSRDPAAWYLELRNIYELRGRRFTPDNFDLRIEYAPTGQAPQETLPDATGISDPLLQLLGLDRLDDLQARRPDNSFDFIRGVTINPQEGLLIFPYLEPFGARLRTLIEQQAPPDRQQELIDELVFSDLYRLKKRNAQNSAQQFDVYRIRGEYRGSVPEFYDLGAPLGLVDGSVEVTSNGTPLQEGVDYEVNYQGGGTVRILNDAFLQPGRSLNITYEQNALFNVQKKTLLGARADYRLADKFSLGATVMRLSERAITDKFRIGQEPISNMIWGLDGTLNLEPRWLTRAMDALPLVQTKAPSAISLSAEFAQLRPGHAQTNAFARTRRDLHENGLDFRPDELRGISYVDDFERFENTFSLATQVQAWQLSAPPVVVDDAGDVSAKRAPGRAALGWYQLNVGIRDDLEGRIANPDDPAARLVDVHEVFPNRDTRGEITNVLTTFDLYFDPQWRGPYNYTHDLDDFLRSPKENWGGITRPLPEGFNDFSVNNVEFIEFIFRPFVDNAANDAGDDAVLYVDLGSISEDIVPDRRLNTEDGLSTTSFDTTTSSDLARLPTGLQDGALDLVNGRTEDLGLDGLVSYNVEAYPETVEEQRFFSEMLDAFATGAPPPGLGTRYAAEVARAERDPSGDDYHHYLDNAYFGDPALFPGGATLQERFLRYNAGLELNGYESQNVLAPETTTPRGNTRAPNTEDLNFNSAVDTENRYFQYAIPLSRETLDALAAPTRTGDYVVGEIRDENGNGTGWYQVRIPVRAPKRKAVGDIRGFSLIESIRLWTTGHAAPITLRFATLELVGSQWRKSEQIALSTDPNEPVAGGDSRLTIASINNEENAGVYAVPPRAIISQTRQTRGSVQNQREQSLVIGVEGLEPGRQRAIYKVYSDGFNLLKYSNLRMFVHLHGMRENGLELTPEERGKVALFVRLGSNEADDFYEYEQPLTPVPLRAGLTAQQLWLAVNEMNLPLSALNQLKVARDQSVSARTDSLIYRSAEALGVDLQDGARLGIKGTPSLQRISTIVIGLRNTTTGETLDLTMWVNELRVTGYDEQGGWAARATARIELADVATVRANFQRQTDGFGALSSTLTERALEDRLGWGVTAQFYADRLLPTSGGWQIPISVQFRSETSTPRFAPSRGDVRIREIQRQIEANDDFAPEEQARLKEAVVRAAQDHRQTRSFSIGLQKQGSDADLLRYTLDALSLNYSYSATDARSPSQRLNDNWRWSGALQYQLDFEQPRTVRPFWFLDGVPLLGALGGLQFNYVPQSIGFSATAERRFGAQQARVAPLRQDELLPEPLRARQDFNHRRQFSLQYQPFDFLNLSFDTNTNQTLNTLSADRLYSVVTGSPANPQVITETKKFGILDRSEADRLVDSLTAVGKEAFRQDRLRLDPIGEVIGDFFGARGPRTESYQQRFAGTLRLPFGQDGAIDWLDVEDLTYQSFFSWENGPLGRNTGATVSNELSLSGGLTLHPRALWRKFAFYREMEAAAGGGAEEPSLLGPPADTTAADTSAVGPDAGGSFLSDLLPDPVALVRRLFLAVTGVRDFQVSYSASRGATSTGVGRGDTSGVAVSYSLLDALRGRGAPLGYRFGLVRGVGRNNRIFDSPYQATDLFSDGNELRARTTIELSPNLLVNLNWDLRWDRVRNRTYDSKGQVNTRTESGANTASVWAFGGSYLGLVERQLRTLREDMAGGLPNDTLRDAGDGQVILTNTSVRGDFRRAFLRGPGPVDGLGLLPFPMPGWNVRYQGLASWPLLHHVMQSASLQHAYTATYTSAYRNNTAGAGLNTFTLAGRIIEYERPAYTAGNLRITERYQPFLGVDINWKGGLQTSFAWNRQNDYFLSTVNNELTARRTRELTFSASFQKQGLDIPLLPPLDNRISFSLSISHQTNRERRYNLRRALSEAIANPDAYAAEQALIGENVSIINETTRLAITPRISYQISNRVAADFLLQYERFNGNNRRPSYTSLNGGFNVRVSVAN